MIQDVLTVCQARAERSEGMLRPSHRSSLIAVVVVSLASLDGGPSLVAVDACVLPRCSSSCENKRFQFKIILNIPAKVVVSYGFPGLSIVRSVSTANQVEFLVACRAMMTPPHRATK